MNSKGARGHKKFIPVWIKGTMSVAKIQRDFPAEIGISNAFSNFKSTKNTNLGLDLRFKAPNLLISSGHSPCLGGLIFVWGAQAVSWGARPRYAPPWRRVWNDTISNYFYNKTAVHKKMINVFSKKFCST